MLPPYYTNPYSVAGPLMSPYTSGGNYYQQTQPLYMISVDGENSAKSWSPSVAPQPNTIIPLFDSDGEHIYFKTYDAYGRTNPIRRGRIVFDDEVKSSEETVYVTKDEYDRLCNEIKEIKESLEQKNQNGSKKQRVTGDEQ